MERQTFDLRMKLAARRTRISPDIGLVYADDETIRDLETGTTLEGERYGLFWPRYVYGRVLRELRAQGAKAVGFDIHFSEIRYDQASIEVPWSTNTIDSDEFFARELLRAEPTKVFLASRPDLLPAFIFRHPPTRMADVGSVKDLDGVARRIQPFEAYHDVVVPSFQSMAARRGANIELTNGLAILVDVHTGGRIGLPLNSEGFVELTSSGGVRRQVPAIESPRVWHLGLALGAFHLELNLDHARLERGRMELTNRAGLRRSIPTDSAGRVVVDWGITAPFTNRVIVQALQEVLRSDVARQAGATNLPSPWKGKLVVVGAVGTGNNLRDQGPTPLNPADFLVGTHLNVANMVLTGSFIRHPGEGWLLAIVGLLAAIVVLANRYLEPVPASVVVVLLASAWVFLSVAAFVRERLCLPVVHPVVNGMFLSHGLLLMCRVMLEQKERQRIRSVFTRMVSPDVVHELLAAEDIRWGGARRQISVFFADVRGFTEMTDRNQEAAELYVREKGLEGAAAEAYFDQQAGEVLDTVNLYLAGIADVIKKHRGTLDKYIGDCVMAFWGAPTANPNHAADCVRAAVDAQRAIQSINEQREQENERRRGLNVERSAAGLPPYPMLHLLTLGTGVNSGTVTVGLMGSDAHLLNYTIFGREVNLASRLEAVSGHGRIIIGEATYWELARSAPELAARCLLLNPVAVKGFRNPVRNYEVLWRDDAEAGTVFVKRSPAPAT